MQGKSQKGEEKTDHELVHSTSLTTDSPLFPGVAGVCSAPLRPRHSSHLPPGSSSKGQFQHWGTQYCCGDYTDSEGQVTMIKSDLELSPPLFLKHWFACLCVRWVYMRRRHTYRGHFGGICSLLPPCGFWRSNIGHSAWQRHYSYLLSQPPGWGTSFCFLFLRQGLTM